MNNDNNNIDFIIPWVNGEDEDWLTKKRKYSMIQTDKLPFINDDREIRYKDWDLLKFWFRSVEKYAPWVNNIFFVTDNQIPEWLNKDHSKLVIKNHSDFIPPEYLPTFSSHAIELNFHRIEELAEHFVYFNDDMFLNGFVTPDFFFKKGKPCDWAIQNIKCFSIEETLGFSQLVDTAVINKYFDKRAVMKKNKKIWFSHKYGYELIRNILLIPWKQFPDFYLTHTPSNMLKSTYVKVWDKEFELLDKASRHKIRNYTDVNQWLFTFWNICEGNIEPVSPKKGKAFTCGKSELEDEKIRNSILNDSYKMICIGEDEKSLSLQKSMKTIYDAFEYKYPDKCSFEK